MRQIVLLRLGDRLIAQAPGYGDMRERPSELVCADRVNGYMGAKFSKRGSYNQRSTSDRKRQRSARCEKSITHYRESPTWQIIG